MSEIRSITLDTPVDVDGQKVGQLSLRVSRKVRDRLAAARLARESYGREHGNEETEICLFAVLAGVPVQSIEELDIVDYAKLQEAYAGDGFLSRSPNSGEPSSPSAATPAGD